MSALLVEVRAWRSLIAAALGASVSAGSRWGAGRSRGGWLCFPLPIGRPETGAIETVGAFGTEELSTVNQ